MAVGWAGGVDGSEGMGMWTVGERGDGAGRKTKNSPKLEGEGTRGHKADLVPRSSGLAL